MIEFILFCTFFACVSGEFVCPRVNGTDICPIRNYPNPVDCTSYYSCTACVAYLMMCPDGLHYSASTDRCDFIWAANCLVSTTSTSTTATTTYMTTSTPSTTTMKTTAATTRTSLSTGSTNTVPSTTTMKTTAATTRTSLSTGSTNTVPSTTTTTTTPRPGYGPTFTVAMDFAIQGALDPVNFNRVFTNIGQSYNGGYFQVPETGVYFFHTSVAAKDTEGVTFALNGAPYFSNILRTSRAHNGPDTMARDFMVSLTAGNVLKIVSSNPAGIYSDGELQTSWSGFSLSAAMRNLVAFCATRTSPFSTIGRVVFPEVILNVGSGFQTVSNTFRAPTTGTYYFSYSTGAPAFSGQRTQLISNLRGNVVELWRDSNNHNGLDTLSRSTLVNLIAGEEVWIGLEGGAITSYPESRAISFCGFLYDPKASQVAWSVHRTSSWASSGDRLDPVEFQDVIVDTGGAWNPSTNYITIPRSGRYFVHVNVGALSGREVNFNMVYNNIRSAADVIRRSVMHNGVDTLGRGIIGDFDAGDQIRITASPGTGIYSDDDRQTSFTGFLLFEQ